MNLGTVQPFFPHLRSLRLTTTTNTEPKPERRSFSDSEAKAGRGTAVTEPAPNTTILMARDYQFGGSRPMTIKRKLGIAAALTTAGAKLNGHVGRLGRTKASAWFLCSIPDKGRFKSVSG